ncbi:MAG TPA: 3-hydroxybutyryl-CoA dehydrogenase [Blastocatellia bacterium]|nr:3-hydroxybutyryl-CoA dehydrogenase [Blastocatellia bacterium]
MIKTFGVSGAGQMGGGIAQVAARAGFRVILQDIKDEFVQRGLKIIDKNLQRDLDKQRITAEEKAATIERILPTTDLQSFADADIVVEAVTEDINIKLNLFRELDRITRPDVILASNTSSISITRIAAVTQRPANVIGMHFMNPVPVMKLVEIIRGVATSNATFQTVKTLSEQLGKTPVEVNDAPGFVSNRVLMPMINEAVFALYESVGTPEAIDTVMKLGMNHPMGPLALADLIGLDTCLAIMNVLYDGFQDSKYRPCPLLKKYVDAGWLGRKTKRGFYTYE